MLAAQVAWTHYHSGEMTGMACAHPKSHISSSNRKAGMNKDEKLLMRHLASAVVLHYLIWPSLKDRLDRPGLDPCLRRPAGR